MGAIARTTLQLFISKTNGMDINIGWQKLHTHHFVSLIKNPYIPIMAILLVIGDRALFEANANPQSTVVAITLIKRSSVFVSILCGKLMFKEKNILYRVMCAAFILLGIWVSVM